ncbi:SURF1 family cytochrome oxidase biogenesis protein [Leifsonia poae]|uniref:SURF1 family cytochrome oxidase biogenesis protein n=1 Tax=Leifsonia poae TaxID=110933 RepID=UPI001CC163E9|nr:SURF1 family cytochrome oxidase biogenesis protein [Leifsonia poae]
MMLRPRWIGALVLCLALAAGFAALGQWQLERAIESGKVIDAPSETVLPLAQVAKPNGPIEEKATGQYVTFTGSFVPTDYQLLEGRLNYGTAGWWVVAHVTVQGDDADGHPVAMAVARGWAADKATAESVLARLANEPQTSQTIVGRLLPTEAPVVPTDKAHPTVMSTMSAAALYNLWTGVDGTDVFSAYVVERTPPEGLVKIDSPPPIQGSTLNWLNIFYAAEWIVFAGFAIFFWFRLVKDAKEKEDELRELEREPAARL